MIVSIAQPAYWMWLGLVERIARSDVHIVLDCVDHSHGSFTNRNKIRAREGWQWLTVPLRAGGSYAGKPIRTLAVDGDAWRAKHRRSIDHAYARAPHAGTYRDALDRLYAQPFSTIADVCAATTRFTLDAFAVPTPLRSASEMEPTKRKSDLVLELVLAVGGTTYLSGPFGRDYLDEDAFAAQGVAIVYHDYIPRPYTRFGDEPFVPALAALDLLMNAGAQARGELELEPVVPSCG